MKTRLHRTRKSNEDEQFDDMDDTATSNVSSSRSADARFDDGLALDDSNFDAADTVRYAAADLRDDEIATDEDHATDDPGEDWDDVLGQFGIEDAASTTSGASVITVKHQPGLARNPAVEALWFRLSNPDFVTTALVPVPAVTSSEANDTAVELARVGASITGQPVNVVTAVGLRPGEAAETSRNIAQGSGGQTIVVVESPGVDPSSIPILRSCPRVVLLVGLERSRSDALAGITNLIGADRVVGSVCLERDKTRRWWNLRRR